MGTKSCSNLPAAVSETTLDAYPLLGRGKVRDIYDLDDRLLIITTDRISAFDFILGSAIPDKGKVLTQISKFWFEKLGGIIPNHFLSEDLSELNLNEEQRAELAGRTMIVKKAKPLPVECIVRGYLVGSGWKEYQKSGTVCGAKLRDGYEQASQLDEPIFTPSTKAEDGDHDENISYERMEEIIGADLAAKVRDAALALYTTAADLAKEKGIIIADTKFEFGMLDGELILIDEALSPDSSRFWDCETYCTGSNPPSFDKQFVRDWLEQESGWDKQPPAPTLPEEVMAKTRAKYVEAYERITGLSL
ncbi:MAG: phosphoribosylaminoimidazolesuccinocarboxamide synthase [Planctomycetota bacterium]|jgi:phosphoribosylaminoimidazole-succinocarboxamide synthase